MYLVVCHLGLPLKRDQVTVLPQEYLVFRRTIFILLCEDSVNFAGVFGNVNDRALLTATSGRLLKLHVHTDCVLERDTLCIKRLSAY